MKSIRVAIAFIAFCLCAAASAAGRFEATSTDTDVRQLVERLAAIEGKKVKWGACFTVDFTNAADFNKRAGLENASTLAEALDGIFHYMERNRVRLEIDEANRYTVMEFSDMVVVGQQAQNGCVLRDY